MLHIYIPGPIGHVGQMLMRIAGPPSDIHAFREFCDNFRLVFSIPFFLSFFFIFE